MSLGEVVGNTGGRYLHRTRPMHTVWAGYPGKSGTLSRWSTFSRVLFVLLLGCPQLP